MHGIAVTLLTEDKERLTVLQQRLESTQMGRNVFGHVGFPASATDAILRQIQDVAAEVVLVDIDPQNPQRAMNAIELIHANTVDIVIFAVGPMVDPGTIVSAMRAGAREYMERNATPESMVEAFTRFAASRGRTRTSSGRARVFVVANAKGGAGATTVAVNTAVALQELHGGVLLVDFALLGHAALHLNIRPTFGLSDALQNLHRMDTSLLQGLMTPARMACNYWPVRKSLITPFQPQPNWPVFSIYWSRSFVTWWLIALTAPTKPRGCFVICPTPSCWWHSRT